MAFTPNTKPSTTSNSQYDIIKARTIVSGLDSMKPDVKAELVRVYGLDSALGGWMRKKNAMSGIKNMQTYHVEKQAIRSTLSVAADTPGAATATLTVTNTTAVSETQAPFIATGTRTTIPVRQQDIVEFDNGVQALVTAVSGATFTVHSVDGSDIPDVTTSSVIRVLTNAVKESSDSVESRFTQTQGYTSLLQRIRNTETISGDSLALVDWNTNLGKGGNSDQYFSEQLLDYYVNHENDVDLALLTGKTITNTTLANVTGQETVQTTTGYIPWVESNGNVETYTDGAFSLDEIDAMITKVTKYRGSKEYELWTDLSLSRQIDDFMRAETGLVAGGVVYSTASKDRYVDYGFKSFTRSGVTIHNNVLPVFNMDEYLGGSTRYTGMGLFMPMGGKFIEADGNKIRAYSCEIIFQDAMGYEQGTREWIHGGRSAGETNGVDNIVYDIQSVVGFRGVAGNTHGLFKVA